jgi:hypothetical protein
MSDQAAPVPVHVSDLPYSTGERCGGGGCPAVYEKSGVFFVVGRKLSDSEKLKLPASGIEDVVEVPRELLIEAAKRLL